jgi:hypothetical protein
MKKNRNLAALALGVLIFTGAARASGAEPTTRSAAGPGAESNPYCVIFQRSLFGLVPPPPAAEISATDSPPDIVLNGIMTVFDRKYALFKLPADKGKSYLLGEGQSDGEIKLLSVDDRAGVIKINNHGIVQTIALAKPPAPSRAPVVAAPLRAVGSAPEAGIVPMAAAGGNPRQIPVAGVSLPTTENSPPTAATSIVPAGYATMGSGNSGNFQGGSSGGSPPSAGGSNSTPTAVPEPWWAVASRNMEAARIATADLVNSGQAEPFPLTPFTPPGTPANLIGDGQLYFVGASSP